MKPKLPASPVETPITVATPPPKQTIGQIHSKLWDQGILTKSMVNTFYKCPIQLERRHVYGEKVAPGFVSTMGNIYAFLNEQAGLRHLMGMRSCSSMPGISYSAFFYPAQRWIAGTFAN